MELIPKFRPPWNKALGFTGAALGVIFAACAIYALRSATDPNQLETNGKSAFSAAGWCLGYGFLTVDALFISWLGFKS